jgi:hypothetical protein
MKGILLATLLLQSLVIGSCMENVQESNNHGVVQISSDSLSNRSKDTLPKHPPKGLNYNQAKINFNVLRIQLKQAYSNKTIGIDSVGQIFTKKMIEEIIPFWYGTEWDFNGYTSIPKEGVIACGYFVSTTLLHSSCQLNRYKMAQKPASGIVEMLKGKGDTLKKIYNTEDMFQYCKSELKNGLYVLGLSFHVGYLYKDSNACYFIHSNYINNQGVVCERIENSNAFKNSGIWTFLGLCNNKYFLESWLNGTTFQHSTP